MLVLTGYLDGCIIFHREVYQSVLPPGAWKTTESKERETMVGYCDLLGSGLIS